MRAPQLHFAEGFHTGHTPQRSGRMEDSRPEPRPSPPRSSGVETFHWPDKPNCRMHESSNRLAATGHRCRRSVYTRHGQPTDIRFHHSNGCRLANVTTARRLDTSQTTAQNPIGNVLGMTFQKWIFSDLVAKAINATLDTQETKGKAKEEDKVDF